MKFLVVDDSLTMRRIIKNSLQKLGFADVSEASNGLEALEEIGKGGINIVLTDWNMPEMDGIELARRATELDPDLKVMFITGFAAVSLRAEENVPQAKLLSKPFHLKDLVREVDMLFGQADRSSQP